MDNPAARILSGPVSTPAYVCPNAFFSFFVLCFWFLVFLLGRERERETDRERKTERQTERERERERGGRKGGRGASYSTGKIHE